MKFCVCVFLFFTLIGCSSNEEAIRRLNLVAGHIKYTDVKRNVDDLNNAEIQFHGVTDQKIKGTINEGVYSVSTEEDGEWIQGAPEGDYKVTIVLPKQKVKVVPAKYRDVKTTDLNAHIVEGINKIDFELSR
jgi:hypothetical protein